MRLVRQHSLLRAVRPFTLLATNLFNLGALRIRSAFRLRFDFVEQQTARKEAIQTLVACGLTFDLHSGRTMKQHHASGCLVDVLPAVTAGTDEGFLNVGFAHSQLTHALGELVFLFKTDRECAHTTIVAVVCDRRQPHEIKSGPQVSTADINEWQLTPP
jgi:hypothetical protein